MDIDPRRMTTREMANEFLAYCRRRQLSPKTVEFYQWSLDKLALHCPEWPTDAEQVAASWDSPTLGRVSRADVERGIRVFLSWADENHGCPDPLRKSKRMPKVKTLPRVLEEEEATAVWDACANPQERAMIALLLDTGIRLGELAGLRWADVGRRSLSVTGKTGARLVPVSPAVREVLTGLGDKTHLWVSSRGPMSIYAVQMVVNRVFQRSGLRGRKLGAHLLRHTFATHYVGNGGNVVNLQRILGHTSLETTMIYVHLSFMVTRADHAVYSPAGRFLGD